jgi:hypothetical protein
MTALVWKGNRDVHVLTNMHAPPAEGNFCDQYGNAIKLTFVEDYNIGVHKNTSATSAKNVMWVTYLVGKSAFILSSVPNKWHRSHQHCDLLRCHSYLTFLN